jgi:hypothetical protein
MESQEASALVRSSSVQQQATHTLTKERKNSQEEYLLENPNHPPKRKRTRLTIGDKKNLIRDAESGTLTRDALAAKWKIGARTVFFCSQEQEENLGKHA